MRNLLSGWDLRRILYLIGGIWMVAQAVMDKIWFLVPFGLYFMFMAILRVGCAAGNCTVPYSKEKEDTNN